TRWCHNLAISETHLPATLLWALMYNRTKETGDRAMRRVILPVLVAFAVLGAGSAATAQQQPSLDRSSDMLDTMTRRLKLCAEIQDTAQGLACYARVESGNAPTRGSAAPPPAAPPPAASVPPPPAPQVRPTAAPPPAISSQPIPDPGKV